MQGTSALEKPPAGNRPGKQQAQDRSPQASAPGPRDSRPNAVTIYDANGRPFGVTPGGYYRNGW